MASTMAPVPDNQLDIQNLVVNQVMDVTIIQPCVWPRLFFT